MYKHCVVSGIICVALVAPTAAHAAVVISEIAWMGTTVSANAEWIELQNTDTTPVSLSGWTLISSSGTPSISLSGTIAGNGYYLLERTSDTSVPTVTADQIYSGALANTGLTLTLKDFNGAVVDSVVGGTDWKSIGGDNGTKQTPQLTSSGWVTGEPTPRALYAGTSSVGSSSDPGGTSPDPLTPQPSVFGSPVVYATAVNPIPRLYIDAGPGRQLTAGAEVPFSAHVYDSDKNVRRDAHLSWNFGDGAVGDGNEVTHSFTLPGTYTVVVSATTGASTAVSTLTVEASLAQVTITESTNEYVSVRNTSTRSLDLSLWKIARGASSFTMPPYTLLSAGQEAHFPEDITKLSTTTEATSLLFPDGRKAFLSQATSSAHEISTETQQVSEVVPTIPANAQPEHPQVSIQRVEESAPPKEANLSFVHEPQTLAPSATVNSAVLGASVGSVSLPKLLTSPWTASFIGLLVAAGGILVIL